MSKINEFINSGTLEAYCLGMVCDGERRYVENICSKNNIIQAELEGIQRSLEYYAASFQLAPPAYIKDRILFAIDNLDLNIGLSKKKGRRR
ncbi:MAG: hypothetical protein R3E32_05800 [Chitinophagales bacterium]